MTFPKQGGKRKTKKSGYKPKKTRVKKLVKKGGNDEIPELGKNNYRNWNRRMPQRWKNIKQRDEAKANFEKRCPPGNDDEMCKILAESIDI